MALTPISRAWILAALPALVGGCALRRPPSPFVSEECPLTPGPRYAVVARAFGNHAIDSVYLAAIARAVVYYWNNPRLEPQSPEAARAMAIRSVRYAVAEFGDWHPGPADTAEVAFTIRRGGKVAHARLLRSSNDSRFGRSLLDAVAAAERWRDAGRVAPDTLPRDLPPGAGDTAAVTLRFGGAEGRGTEDGTVLEFARQNRPVLPVAGNPPPRYPVLLRERRMDGSVLVSFQVTSDGSIREGSVDVLRSTHAAFTAAVFEVLPRHRFQPALLDCEPVPRWVQLPVAFLLRTVPDSLGWPPP